MDNRGIGWIIAGVVLQWVGLLILLINLPALASLGGGLLFLLLLGIGEATLCTVGVVQLNKGYEGWITFFLIYSIIGIILVIFRGIIPIGPILLLVGAIVLKINN